MLDYCAEVVNRLDYPSARTDEIKEMKFEWCVGYLQATADIIQKWRIAAAMQIYAYQQKGEPAFYEDVHS